MRTAIVAAALVLVAAPAAAAPPKATQATFAHAWTGHTRSLEITPAGAGHEVIDDGCCEAVIDLRFRLLRVAGTTAHATATVRVTRVRLYNKKIYWQHNPGPHVGEVGRLTLTNGVVVDSLTGANYCGPHRNACGA